MKNYRDKGKILFILLVIINILALIFFETDVANDQNSNLLVMLIILLYYLNKGNEFTYYTLIIVNFIVGILLLISIIIHIFKETNIDIYQEDIILLLLNVFSLFILVILKKLLYFNRNRVKYLKIKISKMTVELSNIEINKSTPSNNKMS